MRERDSELCRAGALRRKTIRFAMGGMLALACATGAALWMPGRLAPLLPAGAALLLGWVAVRFLLHKVAVPLERICAVSTRIAHGNLDKLLPDSDGSPDLASLAGDINDIAVNLQEILHHFWNSSKDGIRILDRMEARLETARDPDLEEDIRALRQGLEEVREIITSFDFYQVDLQDERLVAGLESGQDPSGDPSQGTGSRGEAERNAP